MLYEQIDTDLNFSNIEELLSPITPEKPCGEYLRRHEFMIKLKALRSQLIENNEDHGIWAKKNNDLPKWEDVSELCEEILTKYSKDLQVLAYYSEAKLKIESFLGLAKSLSLFLNICQNYWSEVFPLFDEENLELRFSAFQWLQSNLPILIRGAPLTKEIPSGVSYPVSWFWYESEINIGVSESLNAKNFLINSLEKENDESIFNLISSFQSILDSLNTLENDFISIFSHNDGDEITFSGTLSLCEEILSFVKPIYLKRVDSKLVLHEDLSFENNEKMESNATSFKENENKKSMHYQDYSGGEFSSCDEAYQLISKANQFLLLNDPHSPSPYLIRRALEWRKKSLYGVLMELFTTTSKPQEIFTLLGLSHSDKKGSEY
jgi:type VI secretion system protein ImpA